MPTLTAASATVSPPANPPVLDEDRIAFYRDLVEPFGATVDDDLLRACPHVSHHDLIDDLLGRLSGQGTHQDTAEHKVELVVLAHALPDIHPFSVPALHLVAALGGSAVPVGIFQQGVGAAFTALRVVAAYQRTGRCANAAVAILEQTTLPTRFPLVHDTPLVDSGALLLLGLDAGPHLGEVQTVGSQTELIRRLTELAGAGPDTLLALGPWVTGAELPAGPAVHRAAVGTYCTSVWLELARHRQHWQERYRTVVLADTDPRTGLGHLAVLRSAGERP